LPFAFSLVSFPLSVVATLIQFAQLALIGWLPGAAVFRLPWLDRDRRAELDAEERGFWAIVLSLALSLGAVIGLAAFHRYSFGRLLVADIVVLAACAIVARGRLRLGRAAKRVTCTALVPIALVALGIWRFFPPSEYIIGGKDPGTYINEGVQIAQRGALVIHDPVVASVPPFARDLFFPSYHTTDYDSLRFMGFFVQDVERGTVVGQFPHLFPASIAIGYGIDGLTGARRTVGVWAILGLLAVYFAGARLAGRAVGAAAAGLLALHVITVWFAKYPNAEVVMQALLFAALLANARAHVDGDPFFAPVAGALLGLLLFLRFDVVLGIMGVAAGLALGAFSGQRARPSFVATFVVVAGAAVAYLLGPLRAYAAGPILFLQTLPTWESWALIMVALTALALLALSWRLPEGIKALGPWVPIAIVAGTWVLAVYALIFRHQAGKLAIHDAEALRTFTNWYFTLPALIAALIGLALLSRRFFRDPALISTVVIFACFLFYKIRIVPNHFWMTRRFLPVILPGALIFASTAVLSGVRLPRTLTGSTRTALRVLFIVLLAGYYVRVSRPVVQHTEYSGLIPKLEQLAKTIGDDDLVIAESRDTGSDVHVLALPLAYIYGRNVLVLYQVKPDKANLAAFLEWARTRYRRVLFIGGGGTDLLSKRYGVRAVASERFQVPEYDSPLNAFPRFVRQKEFEYGVYEFTDPDTSAADRDFDFDVGVGDDLNVVRFHAKETSEGHTFRWTGPTSYLSITHIRPSNRELVLWLSNGGRPPAADPADLSVFLQNQLLGTVRVGNGFTPYVFPIPADLAKQASATGEPVELRLVTRTWNPHKVLGTPDDRNIGVMVDRVAVR
jgi:hypothetical protein